MRNTNTKLAHVLIWISMACAAACIVSAVISLSTMGIMYGTAPGFGEILTYLYQINALLSLAVIAFGLCILTGSKHVIGAKVAAWAVLLLSIMTLGPFVTDNVAYLPSMGFIQAFRYLCAFLPFVALSAILIMLFSTWDRPTHRALRDTSFIATLVAVFACVVYLWQVFPSLAASTTTFDAAQFLGIIFGMLTVTAFCVCLWGISSSDLLFVRMFYGYDSETAAAYVEARKAQEARLPEDMEEAAEAERMRLAALATAVAAGKSAEEREDLPPEDELRELAQAARQESERQARAQGMNPDDAYSDAYGDSYEDDYEDSYQDSYKDTYEDAYNESYVKDAHGGDPYEEDIRVEAEEFPVRSARSARPARSGNTRAQSGARKRLHPPNNGPDDISDANADKGGPKENL